MPDLFVFDEATVRKLWEDHQRLAGQLEVMKQRLSLVEQKDRTNASTMWTGVTTSAFGAATKDADGNPVYTEGTVRRVERDGQGLGTKATAGSDYTVLNQVESAIASGAIVQVQEDVNGDLFAIVESCP